MWCLLCGRAVLFCLPFGKVGLITSVCLQVNIILVLRFFLDRIFRSFAYCKEFRLFAQVHLVRACGLRVYKIKIV